jgi:hypothetical protein
VQTNSPDLMNIVDPVMYVPHSTENQIEETEEIPVTVQEPSPQYEKYLLGSSTFVSQLAKIQHDFGLETAEQKTIREARRDSVKQGFRHAWRGYSEFVTRLYRGLMTMSGVLTFFCRHLRYGP